MAKVIVSKQEARAKGSEVIKEVANIVKVTLGPRGLPILVQQNGQNPDGTSKLPISTKDGVTVAESLSFEDNVKQTIAQSVISVAQNSVKASGDGTTSSIVLAEALFRAGSKYLSHDTSEGLQIYEALKTRVEHICELIKEETIQVTDEAAIRNVALISSNGDELIADMVTQAVMKVGEFGHIKIEQGFSRETTLELVDGAQYLQGWKKSSPQGMLMVNDKARDVCAMDNAGVLLYAGKLTDQAEVDKLLKSLMGEQLEEAFPLLIVAYDFGDDAKNYLLQLRVQTHINLAFIKAPADGSPNARTQILEDLAVLLGGQVMSKGIKPLDTITDEHLGSAELIEIFPETIVFTGGAGDPDEVTQRVADLNKLIEHAMHEFDQENLRFRIGKLLGSIAIVRVGGDSELEQIERLHRMEDALCAAKTAIKTGIVEGAGMTLFRISKKLKEDTIADKILKEALKAPAKQIITNSGESADVILAQCPRGKGYNSRIKKYQNLKEQGIIDPAGVVTNALINAVSVAGMLTVMGGMVCNTNAKMQDGMPNPFAGLM